METGDNGQGMMYFNETNSTVFAVLPHPPNASVPLLVEFMQPEWLHSIQNIGGLPTRATIQGGGQSYGSYRFMFDGTASASVTACKKVNSSATLLKLGHF